MRKWTAIVLLLVMGLSLAGCAGGVDKRIYGAWDEASGSGGAYGFGADGTGVSQMGGMGISLPITFAMKNDRIYISYAEVADPTSDEESIVYGITFFGDSEIVLEYPAESGAYQNYKRRVAQ